MFQVNPLLGRIHMKNQALFSLKDKGKKICLALPNVLSQSVSSNLLIWMA